MEGNVNKQGAKNAIYVAKNPVEIETFCFYQNLINTFAGSSRFREITVSSKEHFKSFPY